MAGFVSDLVARAAPTPAQLAAIEAAIYHFNVELWTLYAFGVAITILRTYARVRQVGWKLKADDYLAWLAIVRIPITQQRVTELTVTFGRSFILRKTPWRIRLSSNTMALRTTA